MIMFLSFDLKWYFARSLKMIQKKIHRVVKYHSSRIHPVDKRSKILNDIVFTKNGLILGLKQLAGEQAKTEILHTYIPRQTLCFYKGGLDFDPVGGGEGNF